AAADPPSLIELPSAVLARIGGVDQELDVALTSSDFDLVGAVDEIAGARLHPEPVEGRLTKRGFDTLAQVGWDLYIAGLERAGERALEPALGVGLVELGARDPNPGTTARST